MKTLPLADARILAPIVAFLEGSGVKAESYLDRLRVPAEMVERGGVIAKKQCHDLLLDVARRERCEEVGFAAYVDFQLADLGPIEEAMLSAGTVKEALDIFGRLASHTYEGNEYSVRVDGDTTWLCFQDNDHESAGYVYSHHVTMMAYRRMVCLLTREPWRPQRWRCLGAEFNAHRNVVGFEDCQVEPHPEESALAVPTGLVGRALPGRGKNRTANVDLLRNEESERATFVRSLQRLIASRFLYRKLPTLDQISVIIGVSPRSIQRYLLENGLSYRGLLDRVCFDAACEMLTQSDLTIREIALELGYSGSNNFVRGFRRMTGVTPSEYRRKQMDV